MQLRSSSSCARHVAFFRRGTRRLVQLGVSSRRAEWFSQWSRNVASSERVHMASLEEGLCRIVYCVSRSTSQILLSPRASVLPVPPYVSYILNYLASPIEHFVIDAVLDHSALHGHAPCRCAGEPSTDRNWWMVPSLSQIGCMTSGPLHGSLWRSLVKLGFGFSYQEKAIKAERREVWSNLEADRSLSAWVLSTLKRSVSGALSIDEADNFEVLRNVTWKRVRTLGGGSFRTVRLAH